MRQSILTFILAALPKLNGGLVHGITTNPRELSKLEQLLEEWTNREHVQILLNDMKVMQVQPNQGGWENIAWSKGSSQDRAYLRDHISKSSCVRSNLAPTSVD